MRLKYFIPFIAFITIITISIVGSSGCANIVPPSGGLRDSLPPVLVKAVPGDSTRNFKGNRITLTFDEFIDLQNVEQNLIVSPLTKNNPTVDFKLNVLTIKIKDTLEPNTTYSLNFGNAVKDYNEGNVLKNFTYILSTGNTIDSLELQGQVILAQNGKTDSTLIVMLHRSSDDSAVIKERPRYVTRLDGKGNFNFKNLAPGTYYLYAWKDASGTKQYNENSEFFAFADMPVKLGEKNEPVTLYAYSPKQKEQQPATTSGISLGSGRTRTSASDRRLRFQTNLLNNEMDLLDTFTMRFDVPLRYFDSSKVSFSSDTLFTPVTNYHFEKDSTNKKILLKYQWKENTIYHFILDKDFAEDSTGKKLLRTDTLTFVTKKLSDYGKLSIRFHNLDLSKNPVLLFIQSNEIKRSFPLTSAEFTSDIFLPGDYNLSILEDKNKNGKWDPGEFFGKHLQPEIVRPITSRPTITIKPNWENEFDIAL